MRLYRDAVFFEIRSFVAVFRDECVRRDDGRGHWRWREIVRSALERMWCLSSQAASSKDGAWSSQAGPCHARYVLTRHGVTQVWIYSMRGPCRVRADRAPVVQSAVNEPHAADRSEVAAGWRRRHDRPGTQLVWQLGRDVAQIEMMYWAGRGSYPRERLLGDAVSGWLSKLTDTTRSTCLWNTTPLPLVTQFILLKYKK